MKDSVESQYKELPGPARVDAESSSGGETGLTKRLRIRPHETAVRAWFTWVSLT